VTALRHYDVTALRHRLIGLKVEDGHLGPTREMLCGMVVINI